MEPKLPRVHLTGPAGRELPFVIGVLAGLSGERSLPPLPERRFIQIDQENFDAVLERLGPRLQVLAGGRHLVELQFERLADFEGEAMARQVGTRMAAHFDTVRSAPEFQALEVAWRSLHRLVQEAGESCGIKIRVLNAAKQELLDDFRSAGEIRSSALFRAVHDEYSMLGGEPYGVLIGDYEFANTPDDLELLERIAAVAASGHAPFLAGASPAMFGWNSFADMCGGREMERIFDSGAYARWRSFRQNSDAAYACLALPRVLLRPGLWGNAAWSLAGRLAEAFRLYGWCAAITGFEGGGLVRGLTVSTPGGLVGPTDAAIDDIQESVLSRLGFVPLVLCRNTDLAAFFSVPSCLRPKIYRDDAATAAARLSASLPYVMAVSRFAHYIRLLAREKRPMSRVECEAFLNSWLVNYVSETDDLARDAKARFPLREGRIEVWDEPGRRLAVMYLRPRFQLLDLERALRVVIELPPV